MINKQLFALVLLMVLIHKPDYSQCQSLYQMEADELGVASTNVHSVIRDNDGSLWIGTDNGLANYNGKTVVNYTKDDGLASNMVWALERKEDTVFAGCYLGGLSIVTKDTIFKVISPNHKFTASYRILHYSKQFDVLIAGTEHGIWFYKNGKLSPLNFPLISNKKSSILWIDEYEGRIFFGVHAHNRGTYELFLDPVDPSKSAYEFISAYGAFAGVVLRDTLFVAENQTIYTFPINNLESYTMYKKVDSEFMIWNMTQIGEHEIYLGGLEDKRFNGSFAILNSLNGKVKYFPDYNFGSVFNIYQDTVNQIKWVSSESGLKIIFNSPISHMNYANIGEIKDIEYHQDKLYILTADGIFYIKEGSLIKVISKDEINSKVEREYDLGKSTYGRQFTLLFDVQSTSDLQYFTKDAGILYVNTTKGVVSLPDLAIYHPFMIGTFKSYGEKGFFSNMQYFPLQDFPSIKDSLGYRHPKTKKGLVKDVFKIIESKGVYYFASHFNGLYAIQNDEVFYLDEQNSEMDNHLTDIGKDESGNVWCTSKYGNLFRIALDDSLMVKSKIEPGRSGIYGDYINWLIFNDSYCYVGTNKGLNIASLENLNSKNPKFAWFFNKYNGFPFYTTKSPVIDSIGNVYLHTKNKIVKIHHTAYGISKPQIFIEHIKLDGIEMRKWVDSVTFSSSVNDLSFSFFSKHFPNDNNFEYGYSINGGSYISGNKVALNSLRSGIYVLSLRVLNRENGKESYRTISFKIKTPIWQRAWFLILVAFSLGSLVYVLMRFRIERLKKRHNERTYLLVQNSELKLQSLQLQMDPHFVFNALNSIQGFILLKRHEDAMTYLQNLSSLLRLNLERAHEEYIPISIEIDFLKKYVALEKIKFKDDLNVDINNGVDAQLLIPPMLIQPIVENAIKHGIVHLKSPGKIDIAFKKEGSVLKVTVKDNGVGRDFTRKLADNTGHKGMATHIIMQRLELLNKKGSTDVNEMEVFDLFEDEKASGTMVVLSLSVKN